jgi:hypothetical protein
MPYNPKYSKIVSSSVILLVLCGLFVILSLVGLQAHTNLTEMDSTAYLGTSSQIRNWGAVGFLEALFTGTYSEANRHPLYMALISPIASGDVEFFVSAKLITAVIGLLFVIVFYLGIYRLYGIVTAALGTLLLVFNATFIRLSTMVACESLLTTFIFLSWLFTIVGFRKKIYWNVAGFMGALAYLSKATGFLALPIFLFSSVFVYRKNLPNLLKIKHFWGFFLIFFLTASPLIVRNVQVYRDPFYNHNKCLLWIDDWQETYRPDFKKSPPTFKDYVRKHTARGILSIFVESSFVRMPRLTGTAMKPFAFWKKEPQKQLITAMPLTASFVWPIVITLFALIGLYKIRKKEEFPVTMLWLCFVCFSSGWYSKMMFATRFVFPIIPFFFIYSALGISSIIKKILSFVKNKKISASLPRIAFSCFILFSGSVGVALYRKFPFKSFDIPRSYVLPENFSYIVLWIGNNFRENERFLISSFYSGHFFYFKNHRKGISYDWPQISGMRELKDYIKDNDIRYGILDLQAFVYRFPIFKNHFGFNKKLGMIPMKEISGFEIVAADPTLPRRFFIFKFNYENF